MKTKGGFRIFFALFHIALSQPHLIVSAQAQEPDWSAQATIPITGRPNPYQWDAATFQKKLKMGRIRAVQYPVDVTGLLIPARPAMTLFNLEPGTAKFALMRTILSLSSSFRNFKGIWEWLGLSRYPAEEGEIFYPTAGQKPDYPMGVSLIDRHGV